jgi:hypothetical protein
MTTRQLVSIVGLVLLQGALTVSAHHAFSSEFDADGKVASWAIECGAPNSLLRRGLNKNSIPIGTEIVVDGYQARDGSPTANAKDITTPDGKKFFVGSSGTGAPYEKPDNPK